MPGSRIEAGAKVHKAIIGENAVVGAGAYVGAPIQPEDPPVDNRLTGDITVFANAVTVPENTRVPQGMFVSKSLGETK